MQKVVTATQYSSRSRFSQKFEWLPPFATEPKSSPFVSPPVVELKSLLHTLKYVYLGEEESLIMIISLEHFSTRGKKTDLYFKEA